MADTPYLAGSASVRYVRDAFIPAGLIHAVRDTGFAQDHTRAKAMCGEKVLAFKGSSFPTRFFYETDDENCVACEELMRRETAAG